MNVGRVAVLWPDEHNFARFREICPKLKYDTLEAYRLPVDRYIEQQERLGVPVTKVTFDPEELLAFTKSRGRTEVDSEMRSTFAVMKAIEAHGGTLAG